MMMKLALSVTAVLTFLLAGGQSYSSRWQYSYGGDQQDVLTTMIPLTGGQFFYAGMSASSNTCTRNSAPQGGFDFVAMLFDNSGRKLWERSYGGDRTDRLHDAIRLPGGGYVLVGETQSGPSGNKTSAVAGRSDLWVVRIDDFGSLVWERSFGGADEENGQRVVPTPDGGFLIGGQIIYTPGSPAGGPSDYIVWKIDGGGNLQWTKTYGGSRSETLTDLKPTADGNFFVSGESESTPDGTRTIPSLGGTDIWILKIRADGTIIWDKAFGSDIDDTRGRLTPLADGNMLIVENSVGMGRLRKVDVDGNQIWVSTCINATKKDVFETLAEDPITGNLYVGGMSNSGVDGCKNSDLVGGGASDNWITTYDPLGHKMEDMDYGGSGVEAVTDIDYLNGEIWVTGWSDSPVSGNKETANCGGQSDGWIVRLYRKFYITAPGSICNTADSGLLKYSTVADFLPGNRFTIQLSDAQGDFTHAFELGHLDAVRSDSIPFLLPPGLRSGTGYRLRIYTSAPTDTSFPFPFTILGPPENLLGPDTALCAGASMVLNTGPQFLETSFLWQDNSTLNTLVVSRPGLYWCEARNSCGVARDSILLTVKDRPLPDLGPDLSFCEGTTQELRVDPQPSDVSFLWNTGDKAAVITVTKGGQYQVTASNICGARTDTLQLTMWPKPPVPLPVFAVICKGSATRLDAGEGQASYLWSTGDTTAIVEARITGVYQVTVTDTRGCTARGETEIYRVVDPPSFFLGSDTSVCENGSVRLKPDALFEQYEWSDGSAAPFFTAERPGVYWLQVTDGNGCVGRDSVVVSLQDCATGLFVPSAFTPNGDGLNDRFHAMLHGRWTEFECSVYDRFGELVFRTRDPADSWDGTVKGVPAPVGTFTWVCRFALAGGERQVQKGTFVLIR